MDTWPSRGAGRTLHEATLNAGLVDVASRIHVVSAGPGIHKSMTAFLPRRVANAVGTQTELEEFGNELVAALELGDGVYSFCMFVAWGRRPASF